MESLYALAGLSIVILLISLGAIRPPAPGFSITGFTVAAHVSLADLVPGSRRIIIIAATTVIVLVVLMFVTLVWVRARAGLPPHNGPTAVQMPPYGRTARIGITFEHRLKVNESARVTVDVRVQPLGSGKQIGKGHGHVACQRAAITYTLKMEGEAVKTTSFIPLAARQPCKWLWTAVTTPQLDGAQSAILRLTSVPKNLTVGRAVDLGNIAPVPVTMDMIVTVLVACLANSIAIVVAMLK
jgi:hypothetical protein